MLILVQVPHTVQQIMSVEHTPVLSGTIPAFESFMSKWEEIAIVRPALSPWINEGLRWAKKYYKRMDETKAYVIAMCEYNHYLFYRHLNE
jgi:hypothetical protein